MKTRYSYPKIVVSTRNLSIFYGKFRAVKEVNLDIPSRKITAIIGPSGCGKSTVLRAFNRMNDFILNCHSEGEVLYRGQNIYHPAIDPVTVRQHIGMVFQKPNPFPKSISDNIAWGAKIHGFKGHMDELIEDSLKQAALWDEVGNDLEMNALSLSGGQQQRLCIARTLAVKPDIILMDEPCSALDPIATLKIEELMRSLSKKFTIIIVTHNMQQAARVSDVTAFFTMDEDRAGKLIEFGETSQIFTRPYEKQTEAYITGRYG